MFNMANRVRDVTGDVMDLLTAAKACAITFVLHTKQIFRLFDLIPFGIFKAEKCHLHFGNLTTTASFGYDVYLKIARTLTHPRIWAAFRAIDTEFDTSIVPHRVAFERRNTQFGWVSKPGQRQIQ
jgi:hypothetical protein